MDADATIVNVIASAQSAFIMEGNPTVRIFSVKKTIVN